MLALGSAFDGVLAAARLGAPWAFERLYQDLARVVIGYLRLQGALEPEDLASEVFLGVFSGLGSFSGSEQQFRSWTFTIAHHRLVDERRHASRRQWLLMADPTALDELGDDAEPESLETISTQYVQQLCACLAPDQRDVLLLRVLADLTAEQIAQVLGKSVGAVKSLQRRGLVQLRKKMLREREAVLL